MNNICLLGLSSSGKTCYLYAAINVLKYGIKVNGHTISVRSTDLQQATHLKHGFQQMAAEIWPEGSSETTTYSFDLMIDGRSILPFTIYDYRGGMLDGLSNNDKVDVEKLLHTFEKSSCIVILVDGNTIIHALEPENLSPCHRPSLEKDSFLIQQKARDNINYIEPLVRVCNQRMSRNVPILLTITKSDMFYPEEIEEGKKLLMELLPSVFSIGNDMIVGITSVTLGENLLNENGKLSGVLYSDTEGNVHLPILFALFQEIDGIGEDADTEETRLLVQELFPSNKINFYRGGKPAFIV